MGSNGRSKEDVREKYFDINRGKDLRRASSHGRSKTYTVAQMWDLHHEIARLIVLGWKNTRIAEHLKCSSQQVSNVRNSPVVQEHIAILRGTRDADTIDIAKDIKELAGSGMSILRGIIEDGEFDGEKAPLIMRAREQNNILDRAGYGAPKRVIGDFSHAHFTPSEIEDIKRRASEDANAVDAEFTEG